MKHQVADNLIVALMPHIIGAHQTMSDLSDADLVGVVESLMERRPTGELVRQVLLRIALDEVENRGLPL